MDVDTIAAYRQIYGSSQLAWSKVGGHLVLFCIHQMHRMNSRNGYVMKIAP